MNNEMVDKVGHKRETRMRGHAPHKLFKMAIKRYLDKKKQSE